ncbi:Uncharacterised protein [Klebsiella pneumoniae]|nr:Uncharacterised protein [Klebsiella pneumoniae]
MVDIDFLTPLHIPLCLLICPGVIRLHIFNHTVPAALYEQMLDELDEKDLVQMITERQNQPLREVDLNQYL